MLVTRAGLREGEWVLVWGIGGGVGDRRRCRSPRPSARACIVTSSSDDEARPGPRARRRRRREPRSGTTSPRRFEEATRRPRRRRRRRARRRGDLEDVAAGGRAPAGASASAGRRAGPTRPPTSTASGGSSSRSSARRWERGRTSRARYELVASGRAKPIVDRVFPLAEASEAHRWLEEGRQLGKVVLRIPDYRITRSRG